VAWLLALVFAGFILTHLQDEWMLREVRRLLRRTGSEPIEPPPDAPSPHQLLGEIARPFAPVPRRDHHAWSEGRSRRNG
jgi:hypothetical protein